MFASSQTHFQQCFQFPTVLYLVRCYSLKEIPATPREIDTQTARMSGAGEMLAPGQARSTRQIRDTCIYTAREPPNNSPPPCYRSLICISCYFYPCYTSGTATQPFFTVFVVIIARHVSNSTNVRASSKFTVTRLRVLANKLYRDCRCN